jgi:hypothetical protein
LFLRGTRFHAEVSRHCDWAGLSLSLPLICSLAHTFSQYAFRLVRVRRVRRARFSHRYRAFAFFYLFICPFLVSLLSSFIPFPRPFCSLLPSSLPSCLSLRVSDRACSLHTFSFYARMDFRGLFQPIKRPA